jgi:transcriptional regulator with XRE-family HTH domain
MGTKLNPDGAKIRALRVQRGWTQEQLAEIAGVSSRTVQRAETADCVAFDTVRAIAGAFGADFDQLLKPEIRGITDPEPKLVPHHEPVSVPHPEAGKSRMVERAPVTARRPWMTLQVAVSAMALGVLAGVTLTYRFDARVGSRFAVAGLDTVAPVQTRAWREAWRPETSTRETLPLPRAVRNPVTEAAIGDREDLPQAEKPGPFVSTAQAAEMLRPADLASETAVHSFPQPEPLDLPLRSGDLLATIAIQGAPSGSSIDSSPSGDFTQEDSGTGAVRQAVGQAGKKTGDFFARVGASMKRVF